MIRRSANVVTIMIPLAVAASRLALAQQPPTTTLTIDLDNLVEYQDDIYNPAKFTRNANGTPSAGFANFGVVTLLGNIVAINGQPAKSLYAGRSRVIGTSPNPAPHGAIADVYRNARIG